MTTFEIVERKRCVNCVICETPAIRVVITRTKVWRRRRWSGTSVRVTRRLARPVCRMCLANIARTWPRSST